MRFDEPISKSPLAFLGSRVQGNRAGTPVELSENSSQKLLYEVFCQLVSYNRFLQVEANWTYLDSVYYAFINMTHIGFGDLINVHRDHEVASKLGPWMWAYRGVHSGGDSV